jgi:hypothetical protein
MIGQDEIEFGVLVASLGGSLLSQSKRTEIAKTPTIRTGTRERDRLAQ